MRPYLCEERQKNESKEFEKKNVDDDYDSIGKDENENENSDYDDLGFEKKNENENENSDADGCNNVSKEEIYENEKNTESQSTEEVFEVFETRHGSPSKDEILDTQEDKEKVDDIKAKEDQELHHMQKRKQTENEIHRRQRQRVEEIRESQKKIKKGYKDALLRFHPDRAPKDDMRKQVEAEETFKLIQRMKERKEPITII
ncbi:hypothetical protein CTI12_AA621580 [Artemisia annua]|uniref:DnaJ domain-containing protein n=1 Tax=Artemisia annua TaxID=35608 RepID=A0A2U1KBQ4_ARTAN|nr:hypothetical protein CTI12_AA621580 [Artemisia annua]